MLDLLDKNKIYAFVDFEFTGLNYVGVGHCLPIEVGMFFADYRGNPLGDYESLIWWAKFDAYEHWQTEQEQGAWSCHGIHVEELKTKGQSVGAVALQISRKVQEMVKLAGAEKCIFVSDNVFCDFLMIHRMFNIHELKIPFHYSPADINFLRMITDTYEETKVHRAAPDCRRMYREFFNSLKKVSVKK